MNGVNNFSKSLITPVGRLYAIIADEGIVHLLWTPPASNKNQRPPSRQQQKHADSLRKDIDDYFSGDPSVRFPRSIFSPSTLDGQTDFQRAVRLELSKIPFAEKRTYGELAGATGRPGAARAVGTACRQNPFPLLIPCHRIVRADGIGGYAGSTQMVDIKRKLLAFEQGERVL